MAKAKKYTYNGSTYTMRELAEIFELSYLGIKQSVLFIDLHPIGLLIHLVAPKLHVVL